MNQDLLLVIDFQNIYMPGQEWACPFMPQAMENTCRIIDTGKVKEVLFTQFLAAAQPVGTWKTYDEEYRHINTDPYLCDMADRIKPYLDKQGKASAYPLAVKSTYSSMKCEQVLKAAEGKDHILLSGVVAECCIVATMLDAMDLGFHVIYLTDCVAGQSKENEAAIRTLAESFAPMHTLVMTADEYLAQSSP